MIYATTSSTELSLTVLNVQVSTHDWYVHIHTVRTYAVIHVRTHTYVGCVARLVYCGLVAVSLTAISPEGWKMQLLNQFPSYLRIICA